MTGITRRMIVLVTLAAGLVNAQDGKNDRKRTARLLKLEERIRKAGPAAGSDELSAFLFQETQRLLERSRALSPSPYGSERMLEAVDDLLDAREDLADAARGKRDSLKAPEADKADEARRETAKRLERAYFRVQQGEYFAKLTGDPRAGEYVLRARQLYQTARAAFDSQEFYRAGKLASASSDLVSVLENLAQAEVRKPEPPVLK